MTETLLPNRPCTISVADTSHLGGANMGEQRNKEMLGSVFAEKFADGEVTSNRSLDLMIRMCESSRMGGTLNNEAFELALEVSGLESVLPCSLCSHFSGE